MTASVQLAPNEGLLPGDALHVETSDWNQNNLWSADKKNRLELQKDGNIVIYRGKAVWASNTVGIPAVQLVMRTDGNLVALDVTGKQVLWQTHTDGHPGAYCVLQNDSNFVVYDKGAFQNPKGRGKLWASGSGASHNWLGNAVKTCGKPLTLIGDKLQEANGALKKLVYKIPFVGKPLFAAMDLGFIGTFGAIAATGDLFAGKSINHAVLDQLKREMEDIHEVAPYVEMVLSVIPGIGPGVSAALAAGLALAAGEPITEVLLDAAAAAIPGGAIAKAAFDVARAGIKMAASGKKVTWDAIAQAGLSAVGDLVHLPPLAQNAISGAIDCAGQLSRGVKPDLAIGDGLADVAKTYIGNAGAAALRVGVALTHAGVEQATTKKHVEDPKLHGKLMASGSAIGKADPVVAAARKTVPAAARNGFDAGVGLSRTQVNAFQLVTYRNNLKPDDKHGFDMALSQHIGRVANPPPKPLAGNPNAQAGYFMTMGMQGAAPGVKQHVMASVTSAPGNGATAKVGATLAVDHITAARSGILYRVESWVADHVNL